MFLSLDYIYLPSRDVATDLAYFTDVLGARVLFAIEAMGTRVAMLDLTGGPPHLVLAGHLDSDRPVLVHRVQSLAATDEELTKRGWRSAHGLEIPQGPIQVFEAPGGQRLAIYELSRPGVIESFAGRRDF